MCFLVHSTLSHPGHLCSHPLPVPRLSDFFKLPYQVYFLVCTVLVPVAPPSSLYPFSVPPLSDVCAQCPFILFRRQNNKTSELESRVSYLKKKNPSWSCRGSRFGSWRPHSGSRPSQPVVAGDLMLSSDLWRYQAWSWCTDTPSVKTVTYNVTYLID